MFDRDQSKTEETLSANDSSKSHDDIILKMLGYKAELYRGLNAFMSFCFCFTTVGIIASISALLPLAMTTGGPVVLVWSWILATVVTISVSLNMAEICSTYPTAGSVYHWAGCLANEKQAPLYSYITGWFNFLGNVAGDAFFAQSLSVLINAINVMMGYEPLSTQFQTLIGIVLCFLWAIQNMLRIDGIGFVNYFSTFVQVSTAIGVSISLFFVCPKDSSTTSDIFFSYYNGTGFMNIGYVCLIGALTSFYSFTGYEASAHMAEETHNAHISAPTGIVYNSLVSGVIGFIYIVGLLYPIAGNVDAFVSNELAVTDIFSQCGGFKGGLALTIILAVNVYFNGMSSLTVTTRIAYAMARDGGFPLSPLIRYVYPKTQSPLGAVCLTFIVDAILLSFQLISSNAFTAVTSIATIGYQISYCIPIILRITSAKDTFVLSSFNLGRYGIPIGYFSSFGLVCTSLLFLLPNLYPVTAASLNYTPVVVGSVFVIGAIYWITSARYTFVGPRMRQLVQI